MTSQTTHEIQFDELKPFHSRAFVEPQANLLDVQVNQAICQALLNEKIGSADQLRAWIMKRSEWEAAFDQASSVLYIQMTRHTDHSGHAENYKNFIENVIPVIKPFEDQLNRKFLADQQKFPLDTGAFGVYIRKLQTDLDLFVEKNIELEKQEALLAQEYQSLMGALSVTFRGHEYTLQQMGKFLLDPDRDLRKAAWMASAKKRLECQKPCDEIFDNMVRLRHQIAEHAGFEHYTAYKFKELHRFDYAPEDCTSFHHAVEAAVVPLWDEILKARKNQMHIEELYPWDLACDPLGRAALKPFDQVDQLIAGCGKIFHKVDEELGRLFDGMCDDGLLDLMSRKGKAPGGYQTCLHEARKPFIFMNAVGVDQDVRTLLHESGHSFHSLLAKEIDLYDYRHAPMEFCECASMSMELLGGESIAEFYQPEDAKRSRIKCLEDCIATLIWVATIDAFQHWIYANPTHTAQQRRQAWLEIRERFGVDCVCWQGLEPIQANLWQRQLHIFEVPFYYIEYAIAQMGALQCWMHARKDWSAALTAYKQALSMGGSRPLPELFATAGVVFDFSDKMIAPLMQAVHHELRRLSVA